MIKFLKTWMLPISMLGGIIFHDWIHYIEGLSPYLIFLMLFVTYTRINLRELRLTKFQMALMAVQISGCWLAYGAFYFLNPIVAQGAFLCVFICTATSAPVITGMLGGSISKLVSYSLLSILCFAFFSPLFLPAISNYGQVNFLQSFARIFIQVVPLLLGPLAAAIIVKKLFPWLHHRISNHQSIAFYLWAVALFIVMGNAVSFLISHENNNLYDLLGLAFASLLVCCLQFFVGRKIGRRFGDEITGAQGLGQKNTILAIWVAMTYMNPIVSIAPGAYVAWQNIINSTQLYFKAKKGKL